MLVARELGDTREIGERHAESERQRKKREREAERSVAELGLKRNQ